MFKNFFKKKTAPVSASNSDTHFGALGGPYRKQEAKTLVPPKNRIKKPYKLSAVCYALFAFLSCVMSGVAVDVVVHFFPETRTTPAAVCIAFMFLAFFCGFQASQKWKH